MRAASQACMERRWQLWAQCSSGICRLGLYRLNKVPKSGKAETEDAEKDRYACSLKTFQLSKPYLIVITLGTTQAGTRNSKRRFSVSCWRFFVATCWINVNTLDQILRNLNIPPSNITGTGFNYNQKHQDTPSLTGGGTEIPDNLEWINSNISEYIQQAWIHNSLQQSLHCSDLQFPLITHLTE